MHQAGRREQKFGVAAGWAHVVLACASRQPRFARGFLELCRQWNEGTSREGSTKLTDLNRCKDLKMAVQRSKNGQCKDLKMGSGNNLMQ